MRDRLTVTVTETWTVQASYFLLAAYSMYGRRSGPLAVQMELLTAVHYFSAHVRPSGVTGYITSQSVGVTGYY